MGWKRSSLALIASIFMFDFSMSSVSNSYGDEDSYSSSSSLSSYSDYSSSYSDYNSDLPWESQCKDNSDRISSHGEAYKMTECSFCRCVNSVLSCMFASCQPVYCEVPIKLESVCCKVCPEEFCGERDVFVNDVPVNLSSYNYPWSYLPNLDCSWQISSNSTDKPGILVSVKDFFTETSKDFLKFRGRTLYGDSPSEFNLHGKTQVHFIIFNSSSILTRFTSDSNTEYSGFLILLQSIDPSVYKLHTGTGRGLFNCEDGSYIARSATCNGVQDCLISGNDERYCDSIYCPKFYQCKNFNACIDWENVCDGRTDCYFSDDEEECDSKRCPAECRCDYNNNDFLVWCQDGWNSYTIANVARRTKALELSSANITWLQPGTFKGLSHLQTISLMDNNIQKIAEEAFFGLTNVTFLILKDVSLRGISSKAFTGLQSLQTLVLFTKSTGASFVEVEDGAFSVLRSLQRVYVDDYRMCCDFQGIKGFSVETDCHTTELQPPLNMCGSLLRNSVLRGGMWVLGLSALIGNVVVIIWRLRWIDENWGRKTLSFIVLNLAASDFVMGVYMLMIAAADLYFGDTYFREASTWRSSAVCKIAGVLSVLSSEASVFFVTLISVDCFLGIVFPFSRLHLKAKSTKIVVILLWIVAFCCSIGPTFIAGQDSDLYGLSDVCIGLPLFTKASSIETIQSDIHNPLGNQTMLIPTAHGQRPAWILSIILFLCVNLVSFLAVLVCYVVIFVSVKRTTKSVRMNVHRDREIKMAVKMAFIVGTDFACWMPVIIMGILSQTNAVTISSEMYAWVVVFILPINSSLNPYLYTFITAFSISRSTKSKRDTPNVELQ